MKKLANSDFFAYQYPSGVQMSPHKSAVAFLLKTTDVKENGYENSLWIYRFDSEKCEKLVDLGGENQFLWETDETILIAAKHCDEKLKTRGITAVKTVYTRFNIKNRTSEKAFEICLPVSKIKEVEKGVYAVIASTSFDQPNYLLLKENELEAAINKNRAGYKVITELPMFENGDGVVNRTRSSLFIFNVKDNSMIQVTDAHWDVNHLSVRSGEVLFSAFVFTDIKPVTEGVFLYKIGERTTKELIPSDKYSIDFIDFFCGGVLCLALLMDKYGVYEHPTFIKVDDFGEHVLAKYDLRVSNAVGSDSFCGSRSEQKIVNDTLFFTNTCETDGHLCSFTEKGGFKTEIGGQISILDFDTDGKYTAFVAFRGMKLPELYMWDGENINQLTHFNEEILKDKMLSQPRKIRFTNRQGIPIDGFVMEPVGMEKGRQYPGILHIHGGPKTVFSSVFHNEMQLWAAAGYFVFYCNPRGSCGRGNDFADLRGKYGTIDFNDIMDFTDWVLENTPQIDKSKVGVAGGSYGGFMTNWVIGHTNRFAAAVSQRSIANYFTSYLMSDIGYYYVPDQQEGTMWENAEEVWDKSPVKYAGNVKTPTLFIHSDMDYRCSFSDGAQMFAALKLHGVETKLCMFYGENHELSRSGKPQNRLSRINEILEWFDKYLK